MALLSTDEEFDRGVDKPPFSNGFEGESWMGIWCEECRHEPDCPLILVAITGRTPLAWHEQERGVGDLASLTHRYTCHEFEQSKELS